MAEHIHWNKYRYVIAVAAALVVFLWTQGTFDYALWRVHLNAKACSQNESGAVFCGSDLKRYRRELETKQAAAKARATDAQKQLAGAVIEDTVPAIELYRADNVNYGKFGYSGMTMSKLRARYWEILRDSTAHIGHAGYTSYCVWVTLDDGAAYHAYGSFNRVGHPARGACPGA